MRFLYDPTTRGVDQGSSTGCSVATTFGRGHKLPPGPIAIGVPNWTSRHRAAVTRQRCKCRRAGQDLKTSLFLALENGRVEVARLLLEHGADAKLRSVMGWTPLHALSENGRPDAILSLLECGADINAQDRALLTPSSLALVSGKLEVPT